MLPSAQPRRAGMSKVVFVLTAGAALAACAAITSASSRNDDSSIYYSSQAEADADLTRFDQDNQNCELWTNWQQLCSRTGPNASVRCANSAVAVEPSTPFCLVRSGGPYLGLDDLVSAKARKSYLRFRVANINEDGETLPDLRWSEERPFNNLRLKELAHPWCRRWALAVKPEVNAKKSKRFGYYCAAREIPSWCDWADGMGYGLQDGDSPGLDRILVLFDPASAPVNGVYCRRRKSDAQ